MNLEHILHTLAKESSAQMFQEYAKILLEWNKTHNLTGAQTLQIIQENILDSIYPLMWINDFKVCLDVGSGAGFPAIALAILKPESFFILTEPRQKRAAFLLFIKTKLNLANIQIEKSPIQQVFHQADLITSRAVMPTKKIITLCSRNVKNNGYYLLYKGVDSGLPPLDLPTQLVARNERIYLYIKGSK